jgi:hypothetical protein
MGLVGQNDEQQSRRNKSRARPRPQMSMSENGWQEADLILLIEISTTNLRMIRFRSRMILGRTKTTSQRKLGMDYSMLVIGEVGRICHLYWETNMFREHRNSSARRLHHC